MLLNKQMAKKNLQLFLVGIVPFPALHLPVGFKQAAQINQSATLVPCSKALVYITEQTMFRISQKAERRKLHAAEQTGGGKKQLQLFLVGIVPFPALHLPVGFKQAAQINQSATLVPCSKALVYITEQTMFRISQKAERSKLHAAEQTNGGKNICSYFWLGLSHFQPFIYPLVLSKRLKSTNPPL